MVLLRVLLLLACLLIMSEVTLSGCPPMGGPSREATCSAPWRGRPISATIPSWKGVPSAQWPC